jgi:hypothetical protein
MGTRKIGVEGETTKSLFQLATLPQEFKRLAKKIREYNSVVIVDFHFIGIPSKIGQHWGFGGKAEIKFKAYGLNDDEITLLRKKLDESDVADALKLVQGMTDESLQQLQLDIDEFLGEEKEKKEEKKSSDTNPFSALFDFGFGKKKKSEKDEKKEKLEKLKKEGVKKDSYAEAFVRNIAIAGAMDTAFLIYDVLKKNYGMASFAFAGEKGTWLGVGKAPPVPGEKLFGFGK